MLRVIGNTIGTNLISRENVGPLVDVTNTTRCRLQSAIEDHVEVGRI